MSDPKDGNESFFRKVVRFVANPATDWADLNSRQDSSDLDLEKSELKAMIERKRRNDFVRKREFDMLRKVRREGLSSEQLAALAGSSRLDDSEAKLSDSAAARADNRVKAKIDEIEQQMVGEGGLTTGTGGKRTQAGPLSTTQPASRLTQPSTLRGPLSRHAEADDVLPALPPLPDSGHPAPQRPAAPPPPQVVPATSMSPGLPPLTPPSRGATDMSGDFGHPFAVEVSEVVHDPELDEAVIAFANADFAQCEQSLASLTGAGGARSQHAETWLVLFDLYRATGQQHKFETLANEYAQQFGWSAPQWFSMPRLVAEAAAEETPQAAAAVPGEVGWVCPEFLDTDEVSRLRAQTLQMPLPWVFDWSDLRRIDAEAATELSELFRQWATEPLEMRWLDGEKFFVVLQDAAPTGVKDVDPALWNVRLDALRLANRPDQFDEAAIDYCVTYEVSPPSWERAKCTVRIGGSGHSTHAPALSQVSEVSTGFLESSLTEDPTGAVKVASLEVSGQLVGDISPTLARLDQQLTTAPVVKVSCTKLIRVDFIAAGDLLNWVLAKRSENRAIHFIEAHRLVALFFGAMGINEHAKVAVRII
jgi:hypothetical protein